MRVPRYQSPPPGAVVLAALPVDSHGRKLWTCSGCGRTSRWGPAWSYFGGIFEVEELGWVRGVACSVECREQTKLPAPPSPGSLASSPPPPVKRAAKALAKLSTRERLVALRLAEKEPAV